MGAHIVVLTERWGYCIMSVKVGGVGYRPCSDLLDLRSRGLLRELRRLFFCEASLLVLDQ
jgi:hypothetical protein